MKKLLFLILLPNVIFAQQVGVNTRQPQQTLHIDGAKDNTATLTPTMIDNDVVVSNNGQLGVGVITPVAKLDIKSSTFANGFRLVDTSQGDGKLLTSSGTTGDLAWRSRLQTKVISSDGGAYYGAISSDMAYINRKVTLEPGRWFINTNLLLTTNTAGTKSKGFYARFSWAELSGSTYILSSDAIYGNEIGGLYMYTYGLAKGNTVINNTSALPKTYYLVTRTPTFWGGYSPSNTWNALGHSFWGETSIIAFPAN